MIKVPHHSLTEIGYFILITITIHFSWRLWERQYDYAPFSYEMNRVEDRLVSIGFNQSVWVLGKISPYNFSIKEHTIIFDSKGSLRVYSGCSGLKQIAQFALLMILYPGPRKKKIWYIPAGIILMHVVNLIRLTGLAMVIANYPLLWDFCHDFLFKILFYAVIFALWVLWVEVISTQKKSARSHSLL